MQYPAIWHSDLIFHPWRDYWARAATNCRKDTDFSKLIAWKRLRDKAGANHLAK